MAGAAGPQQDGRVALTVRCPAACGLGVRLRSDGRKALWVSLGGDDFGSAYLETLGEDGRSAGRELIAKGAVPSPFPSPDPVFIEVAIKDGVLSGWTRGRRIWGLGARLDPEKAPAAGAWSVHGGGATVVRSAFEDSEIRPYAPPSAGKGFTAQKIADLFYAETVSIADLDLDGRPDIATGPRYYLSPDYSASREIYAEPPTDPNGYSSGMLSAADDFDGDGWPDVLVLESGREVDTHAAVLYLNPRGESRRWDRSVALPSTQGEALAYDDVDGDGRRDLVVIREDTVGIARPGADPRQPWSYEPVSGTGRWNPHGVGVGDVDGDGRKDILHGSGWFRQPASPGGPWAFTPADFGFGAQLHVADLNGDGRADVVGAVDAHGWGLAWNEQKPDGTFERHLIMGDPGETPPTEDFRAFSEPHAVAVADLDGDGLLDVVSGKRWWAHKDSYLDPDGQGPSVLYAFLQRRKDGAATFEPRFVGDHVGVGNQIAVEDLDGDGKPEIVASARKGTVIYWNKLRR